MCEPEQMATPTPKRSTVGLDLLLQRWCALVCRHPRKTLAAMLLVSAALGLFASRTLTFNAATGRME